MAIDQRHVVNISGKIYLKYAGVLAEALEQGLWSLVVDLIQIPSEANGNTAICKAVAVFERDEKQLRFVEYGDAAPNNVGPMVKTALIRMAATRAKGRALRDAIGHGEALAEEIPDQTPGTQDGDWTPEKEASPVIRDQFCQGKDCGVELPPAVVTFSKRKFGKSLCIECQKKEGK
jgi:hypothetical protein